MESVEIPNLPGYVTSSTILPPKNGFGKKQSLCYNNGYAIEKPIESANESVKTQIAASNTSETTPPMRSDVVKLPRWVEMDRKVYHYIQRSILLPEWQVLRFYGYFVEAVNESPVEDHRIRRVSIYYYLADDTIRIEEPRQDNSGLTQGVFVKRHRILRSDGQFYELRDFKVGNAILIYGREIHIVDCDAFTRVYYNEALEHEQPAAMTYPTDPIDVYRQKSKKIDASIPPNPRNDSLTRYLEAKLGKPSNVLEKDTLKQYLDNNRMVLRFWCSWDDRQNLFGQRRLYVLHYFLEDDTGEILECYETNSGRDPFPIFLKRGPLIKGNGFMNLGESSKHRDVYHSNDLRIGSTLLLNNREFLIYDCDAFTKKWYKDTFGAADKELRTTDISERHPPLLQPKLPPHNGFGSREDTRQNCIMLVPKPPKKNFLKLMNKDQIVLRFSATLCETERFQPSADEIERAFIVTYYMADDSIAIFEKAAKNSGLPGGKFLERAKIPKTDGDEYYTYHDLYVGAKPEFHRRGFYLLDADEFTYTYMENNKHVFPFADYNLTISDLRRKCSTRQAEIRSIIEKHACDGLITIEQFSKALKTTELELIDHQIATVTRNLSKESEADLIGLERIWEILQLSI